MRVVLSLAAVLAAASPAVAAPGGDLVFVWAPPGAKLAPITAAAERAGAAVFDRSPAAPAAPDAAAPWIQRGMEAYDALRFDDARAAFEQARIATDRSGAADLTTVQLADLWLYRGLVAAQAGDQGNAWDAFVAAVTIAPDRVLDPARFPPRVIDELERARIAVTARPHAELTVEAPAGCTIAVDGATLAPHAPVLPGAHWVRVTCAERAPWGGRVDVTAPATMIHATPMPYAPLDDADALIQARTAGARAFVIAQVHGELATARLIGVDGRERDRRSLTLAPDGDLAPLGAAIDALLATKPVVATHWYQARWVWAAGAATLAAAIFVPLTAAIVHDDHATSATLRFPVQPW